MPIVSEPYWFTKCDNCGERIEYDDGITAWDSAGTAEEVALESDWSRKGDVWHCSNCPRLDDVPGDDAAMCKHCRRPIIRCDTVRSHAGCGSGYGWIHSDPEQWGHSCEPRSGAPYAQPAVTPGQEAHGG
jgi:hypothetical protein